MQIHPSVTLPRFGTIYHLVPDNNISRLNLNRAMEADEQQSSLQLHQLMKQQDTELGVSWGRQQPLLLDCGGDLFGFTAQHAKELGALMKQHRPKPGDETQDDPTGFIGLVNSLLERHADQLYEVYFSFGTQPKPNYLN